MEEDDRKEQREGRKTESGRTGGREQEVGQREREKGEFDYKEFKKMNSVGGDEGVRRKSKRGRKIERETRT